MELNFKIVNANLNQTTAKLVLFFCDKNLNFNNFDFKKYNLTTAQIQLFLNAEAFVGEAETVAALELIIGDSIQYIAFCGLGAQPTLENYRRAIGLAVKYIEAKKIGAVALEAYDYNKLSNCISAEKLVEETVTLFSIAAYKFDTYISKKESAKFTAFTVEIFAVDADVTKLSAAVSKGTIIANAVNRARSWCDTPACDATPTIIAEKAVELAQQNSLNIKILDLAEMKAAGMGGILGVASGSIQPPKFIILEYNCGKAQAKTLGLAGKGITFDSGGLSLKPAESMETMKDDMAGAAVVLNTVFAAAQLKVNCNIVAAVPLTENLPGPAALKPGDIIKFYNGKTAEVKNTDAEGRLVLADALAYLEKNYKLDALIDIATLTGAAIYAVGPFFSALLSDNDKLAALITQAGNTVGDPVWRLPFTADFKHAIKSPIADMQNIGSKAIAAGTITAAWFLREFVNSTPYAHIDIASSAFNVPHISYFKLGATGAGTRLLLNLICSY